MDERHCNDESAVSAVAGDFRQCPIDGSGLGSLDTSLPHFGGDRRELPVAGSKEANQSSGKGVKKTRLLPGTKTAKNVID